MPKGLSGVNELNQIAEERCDTLSSPVMHRRKNTTHGMLSEKIDKEENKEEILRINSNSTQRKDENQEKKERKKMKPGNSMSRLEKLENKINNRIQELNPKTAKWVKHKVKNLLPEK